MGDDSKEGIDFKELGSGPVTVILLHGRGGNAADILALSRHLPPARYLALEAKDNSWYPLPFILPRERNEPALSNALDAIERAIELSGTPREHIVLCGFSQGACLATEFIARNPGKYGGVIAFSGGLIGEHIEPPTQNLAGTPVFLGCSERDPHIPLARVRESAAAFEQHGARVQLITYAGASHHVTPAEIAAANAIINAAAR